MIFSPGERPAPEKLRPFSFLLDFQEFFNPGKKELRREPY